MWITYIRIDYIIITLGEINFERLVEQIFLILNEVSLLAIDLFHDL